MTDRLIERIEREAGIANLVEILSERLAPSDLTSLMLEVYARAAKKTTPARLLEEYERNRFVAPSLADPRLLAEFDRLAWQLLPGGYDPLELAPLCPLGTNSAVASVSQNKVVSAGRNTEVVADSTNVLALECAVRRRRLVRGGGLHAAVLLGATHRLTRAQVFNMPRAWAHFRILSLCAAGRDEGSLRFETTRLREHISYYIRFLEQLAPLGRVFTGIRVAVTDLSDGRLAPLLDADLMKPLARSHPEVTLHLDPDRASGRGYYEDMCFKLLAQDGAGVELELADGGSTVWTRRLLSDAKERLVISGIGVERLAVR